MSCSRAIAWRFCVLWGAAIGLAACEPWLVPEPEDAAPGDAAGNDAGSPADDAASAPDAAPEDEDAAALDEDAAALDAAPQDAEPESDAAREDGASQPPEDTGVPADASLDAELDGSGTEGGTIDAASDGSPAGEDADVEASIPDAGADASDCACSEHPARVVQVSMGALHACALVSDGRVLCWGANTDGQLGDGSFVDRPAPQPVPGLTDAVDIAAGHRHTCAVLRSGGVLCWGHNGYAQLGDGTAVHRGVQRVAVRDIQGAVQVVASAYHTCARLSSGAVRCWGLDEFGQLSDGSLNGGAHDLSANDLYACALVQSGQGRCWGNNYLGVLGNGKNARVYNAPSAYQTIERTPVAVSNLSGALDIATSAGRTCAVTDAGSLWCWGAASGDYVPGNPNMLVANAVSGIAGALAVAMDDELVCVTLGSGSVRCAAKYAEHQSEEVAGLSGVVQIAANAGQRCAVLASGEVRCWGNNARGQLGDGTLVSRSVPTPAALPSLTDPSAGSTPVRCPVLGPPSDGTISFTDDTRVGSIATYACSGGFLPSPATLSRICRLVGASAEWDGESVRCMRPGCGDGVVSEGEECDPDAPNENLWSCTNNCRISRTYARCTLDPQLGGCAGSQWCLGGMCVPRCSDGAFGCPGLPSGAGAALTAQCQYTTSRMGMCFVEGCSSARDCPAGAVCLSGTCSACSSSSQCPPQLPVCAPNVGGFGNSCQQLASCAGYEDCSGGLTCLPVASGETRTCQQCNVDRDCPPVAPYCWARYIDGASCSDVEP